MEFRYHKEQELFTTVHRAIAAALQEKELIPDSTVAGRRNLEERPAPQKVTPRTNPQTKPVRSVPPEPLKQANQPEAAQNAQVKQSGSYSILEQLLPAHVREGFRESMKYHVTPQPEPQAELTEPEKNLATEQQELTEPQKNLATEQPELPESQKQQKSLEYQTELQMQPKGSESPSVLQQPAQSEPLYQQASFTQEKFLSQKASASRRIIGQVFDTYWLFQYEDELFIMDQHAAHEKVNHERFLKEFKSRTILSQQLFPPEVVSVSSSERLLIQENMSLFLDTGFELEEFGGNEYKLNAMPMNLYGLSGRDIFLEFVAALSEGVTGVTEDIFIRKLATMACKAAIKGNQSVTQTEIQHLLEELMTLENPYTCPHGRPTMIRMSKTELEKKFKRIV
jgi:DNA mismatch repair protein MutL